MCHSAALNTCRQIPADTRGWGDRKQLGGFFPWKSVNDSKRPKRKTLGAQTTPAGRKKKNLGFLVTLKELLCFGSLTIWGVSLPKFATYENPNGPNLFFLPLPPLQGKRNYASSILGRLSLRSGAVFLTQYSSSLCCIKKHTSGSCMAFNTLKCLFWATLRANWFILEQQTQGVVHFLFLMVFWGLPINNNY